MPAQQKPTIFGTIPYGNIWYMPAGKSFAATIWQDAGAEYAWQTTEGVGSLQISIEEVIAKAQKTTIWVNTGAFTSLQELIASDNRFANFLAVQKKQVYNCNKRVGEGGGNEFYEYGVIRPDIVLKDLARILYPNIYPNYELYFYQKLE
jgi:iron complex transport system substrate-binding protein